LIAIPTQSLRFDTLSIALSYKDSFYCEWLILLLIYFGKQKTTSGLLVDGAVDGALDVGALDVGALEWPTTGALDDSPI